ncbi:MAG: RnfABCDGE type electron transport complex subunit G [Paludibacteraceae bacterium]|nr:RnfABCDGE type electron transport complex subunit G [Paludibacteraceae bacterium]
MAKLQSSFKNMLLSLSCIALVAAAALAGVYMLTMEPIEKAKADKQAEAIKQVLPQIEGLQITDAEKVYEVKVEGDKVDTISAMTVYKAYVGEEWVATAVEASTEGNQNMPFGGTFRLMVGFDNVGNVVNYVVLEQAETPGLGALMVTWFCNADKPGQNIIGKNPATTNFTVSKDGGDVDAITASTITSRAFLEVVVKAYNAIAQQPMPIEVAPIEEEPFVCPYGNDPMECAGTGCAEQHCLKQKGGQQ